MAETIQEQINRYLVDTISAERNFEKALDTFGHSGEQTPVQQLLRSASAKAKTQHERLEALLRTRGGTPSESKTVLAEVLAFSPLSAQMGQGETEKNTQHLIVTFAAAAAEMAMYESLATVGEAGGANNVVSLARTLQGEERDDYDQVWGILRSSAASAFQDQISEGKSAQAVLIAYLEDVIAAEKSFEKQLLSFSKEAKEAEDPAVRSLFKQHAEETKEQHEQLTARLEELGGSTSILKSFLANVFGMAPKIAQLGHDDEERETQDLMMAYAVENAEVAMYESLLEACSIAGDERTAEIARRIQQQERETAEKVWAEIAPAARRSVDGFRNESAA